MRIINILEIVNGIPAQLLSFPIIEEQLSQEVVDKVGKLFIDMISKHESHWEKYTEEGSMEYYEHEYFDDNNGYELYIIWSEIN